MIRFEAQNLEARSPITVTYPDTDGLLQTAHGELVLNGGTFRGPLRKSGLRIIRRLIAEKRGVQESEVLTLRDSYMNGQGVDVTREVNNESASKRDPLGAKWLREKNPFLSVFGRWGLPGRLAVGEIRTSGDNLMRLGQGARTDMYVRDPNEISFLSDDEQQRLLEQLESQKSTQHQIDELTAQQKDLRKQANKAKKGGEDETAKTLYQQCEDIKQQIKTLKGSREGAEEAIQRPLAGYEAINPGASLSHRLTLLDDDNLGIVVAAMLEMLCQPFLGGHRADGCGEIAGSYQVKQWPRGCFQPETIGSIHFSADEGVTIEGDALQAAYDDLKAKADEIDLSIATIAQARESAKTSA